MHYPPISVVVPVLNESAFIERCLRSLIPQLRPECDEILVVDGGSTDETCEIVRRLQANHSGISLLHNPKRLQAAALNLGAQLASSSSEIIIRADAHADYPLDFIELCATNLLEQNAQSVVVPMRAEGTTPFQRAIAFAQNSRIGNGGSAHRRSSSASRFVDHGHHAAFDRRTFLSLSGYNEKFTHNEDAEYDYRLTCSGGRIWMCSEACITYFPRKSWRALARQYFNHGQGRARTLLLHRQFPKLRQVIPPVILVATIAGMLLAPVAPIALFIPGMYIAMLIGVSVAQAIKKRDKALLAVGLASGIMHLSWGAGFLKASANQAINLIFRSNSGH
nr:glycosyltransferase family 2 protein [Microvirga sp. BSC39]